MEIHIDSGVPLHPVQLLAVSGPFHYWGPVVDGRYLRETPARALQRSPRARVDLLLGSSQDDGLISRAKAVKVGGVQASEPVGGGPGSGPLSRPLVERHPLTRLFTKQLLENCCVQRLCKEHGRW